MVMSEVKVSGSKNNTWQIVKIVLGVFGFLSVILAVLILTNIFSFNNVMYDLLISLNYKGAFGKSQQVTTALVLAIFGILFLFIAFSRQLDKFFSVLEKKELKLSRDEKKSGVGIELLFFLTIAIVLTILVILLSMNLLIVENNLPLLGAYTRTVILISLILLVIVSLIVAFNEIIRQSLKEMKKVHWPKSKEMSGFSVQVFSFIIFFGLLFFFFDYIVAIGLRGLTNLLS